MSRHVAMFFGVLSLLVLQGTSASATYYVVTPLPNLTGGSTGGIIEGMNNLGQVVGMAIGTDGRPHPYFWSHDTGVQDLGLPWGTEQGFAYGINDSGQVVGSLYMPFDPATGLVGYAFLWDSVTGMQDIGNLGKAAAVACGINSSEQIVGYGTTSDRKTHAFSREGTTMQDINVDSGWGSYAYDINDNGQIVGSTFGYSGEPKQACLWSNASSGTVTMLGDFGGGTSVACAINGDGVVVGNSKDENLIDHAFLWTSTGGMQNLIGLDPAQKSYASGINDSGQAVGSSYYGSVNHAVLFEDGEVIDLNTKIKPGMFRYFASAMDINNSGQIVGGAYGGTDTIGTLVFLDPAMSGDANLDGSVNGTDLNAVLSFYNQTVPLDVNGWMSGDFNNDGSVNGTDLNAVLSNYNQSLWSSSTAAVPEPSTLFLVLAAMLSLWTWKRKFMI